MCRGLWLFREHIGAGAAIRFSRSDPRRQHRWVCSRRCAGCPMWIERAGPMWIELGLDVDRSWAWIDPGPNMGRSWAMRIDRGPIQIDHWPDGDRSWSNLDRSWPDVVGLCRCDPAKLAAGQEFTGCNWTMATMLSMTELLASGIPAGYREQDLTRFWNYTVTVYSKV